MFSLSISGQITFQKAYGGSGQDVSFSVRQTKDTGYVLAGYTQSVGAGVDDFYLIKINKFGDTLWTRSYGGTNYDDCKSVKQTADGGYILVGTSNSFGNNEEVYIIKTNSSGNVVWNKTFGIPGIDGGNSVQQTSDGGYIIAGSNMYPDVYLIKTDANGNILWSQLFGGTGNDGAASVQQTSDKGYILVGSTNSFGVGKSDVYLLRTDSTGLLQWSKTFGGSENDNGSSVQQTKDGGFIVVGSSYSFSFMGFSPDVYMVKTDGSGNMLWSKAYGSFNDYDFGNYVEQTKDKGFIVAAYTQAFGAGVNDAYLLKTDSLGILVWSKTYGSTGQDASYAVQQTNDKGYILTGFTTSFGVLSTDCYLIKTDSLGNSNCFELNAPTANFTATTQVTNPATIMSSIGNVGSPIPTLSRGATVKTVCTITEIKEAFSSNQNEINIYPNPFHDKIILQTNAEFFNATLIICDIIGREIKTVKNIYGNKVSIEIESLMTGIYFYKILQDEKHVSSGKIIAD